MGMLFNVTSIVATLRDGVVKRKDWHESVDECSTESAMSEAADAIEALTKSLDDIRDAVLHERFQLAEAGLDGDQVNAILGIIDDNDPREVA